MTLPNPIYHQISFATIQLLSVVRLVHIIRTQTPPQSEARSTVYRLLGTGVASFAGAFGVWNLDNVFCETWRAAREKISPFGFLLEGHGQ
jgi:dihydroceramidase